MTHHVVLLPENLWEKHAMAVEDVNQRMRRITEALETAGVPYALVGGQAVAAWVATRDPKGGPGKAVVPLAGLVLMKLMANRDHDRVHLRDLIDVGLVDRDLLAGLPLELAARLEALLIELGR
ncbi:MAG TPA: hypothetical protein VMV69_10140 [Pirellulales bacterium]|nr:hypothetical protein [Pirellulales bacterium]